MSDLTALWISLGVLVGVFIGAYFYFNKTKHKNDIQLKCDLKDGKHTWYLK